METQSTIDNQVNASELMSERLLVASEVAELLAVPESWVREQSRNGLLPHLQLGRYVRYRRQAILGRANAASSGGSSTSTPPGAT